MSLLNQFHDTDPSKARIVMQAYGPLLTVEISIPQALAQLYVDEKKPAPAPLTGLALIDTGASSTCFDDDLIKSLGVSASGVAEVLTPTGGDKQNTYPVRLRVPTHNVDIELPNVLGVNLKRQKTPDGQPIIGLIGRDFLASFVLIYNGGGGVFTLAN